MKTLGLFLLILVLFGNNFAQKQLSKDEYIKQIVNLANTKKPEEQEKAYQLSKEFFARHSKEKGDNISKIKTWATNYRVNSFYNSLSQLKTAEGFGYGKDILAEFPEDTAVILNLAYGGFDAMSKNKDKSFADQSINYAKQAITLLEAEKLPKDFSPFKNKEDAISWMYYIIGSFLKDTDMKEGVHNFYKATQYESSVKNSSFTYYLIAIYFEGKYEKARDEYNLKLKTLTDAENIAELNKVNKIIDQMLDAYARTVKFAESENNPQKDDWKKRLTDVYKFRKKTDAGIDAFINYINTTPLVDPSTF